MMHPDQVLPAVSKLLSRAYSDRLEAYRASQGLAPWPRRRSKRRKPIPGVYDGTSQDEG